VHHTSRFDQITKHYLPLERDPLIPPAEREVLHSVALSPATAVLTRLQMYMKEWWNKTHELMISSGATRASLQQRCVA
jgi:hypothetical protein